jgi:ATP-dependent exoDNAse (exonuclease V) beta subunit
MDQFTIEQEKCIHFFPDPQDLKQYLLIEAGAGAGKTAVLTERTKWLLQNTNTNINPSQLFIVTFSKDAASQIQERIEKEFIKINSLSDIVSLIHISTIDSFFAELVNCIYPTWWETKQKETYSMPPRLQLVDEEIVCQDLKNAIHHYLTENKFEDSDLALTIDFILSGALKKGYIGNKGTLDNILKTLCNETFLASNPEELRIAAKEIHPSTAFLIREFHHIARHEYEKRILKGEFTYADRTLFLKENLKKNIPIQLQELIVDEYQDTNHIQHEILFNMVLECKARMVVVGDPKQSIYGFRNASVDVFQNLKTHENWKHIELKKNFRSNPSLLNEINKLSSITFHWDNPNYPEEFKRSFFYDEAKKKFTPENSLEPGKQEKIGNKNPCIYIVTASLNKDRFISDRDAEFISENNVNLEKYSLTAYASFLKEYKSSQKAEWKDMVILCEENKDALKLSHALQNEEIPVLQISKTEEDAETSLECRVALSLVRCLVGEEDNFDIYQIMQSPISDMIHTEIEIYFTTLKKNKIAKSMLMDLIHEHKNIAKDNFFKAWQLLRWKLVENHQNEISKNHASLFCARMDLFSFALAAKLESPTFRDSLEKKVKCNLNKEKYLPQNQNKLLLPTSLKQWNISSWENESCNTENYIEIKTVHKAKGLQWKHVCFYPKHGGAKPIGKFVSSLSGRFLDITWLQDDAENMSVVKRIANKKFHEIDTFFDYKSNGEIKKIFRFPNLRKQAEQDFERQRVFYTAFTRAETNLILFQPKRLKKDGLREDLAKVTNSEQLPFQKYLEEEIYLKYLDSHFQLRGYPKPKGKGAKIAEKLLPPEPWLQSDENSPKSFLSDNKMISYHEYGPHFLKNIIMQSMQSNKSNHDEILNINNSAIIHNQFFMEKYKEIDKRMEKDFLEIPEILKNDASTFENKYAHLRTKIETQRRNRELISKGILYHAAAENRKASVNTFQHQVESESIHVFHEFEVWLKIADKNNFLNTSRHIIDFLAIMYPEKLLTIPLHKIYNFSKQQDENFTQKLKMIPSHTKILLVLDYKTGKKETKHITQIIKYMDIITSIKSFEQLQLDNIVSHQFLTIGALCYNKKSDTTNPLSLEGKFLPCNHLLNGEQVFLFM